MYLCHISMGFLKNPCFFVIIKRLDKLQFIFRKDIFVMPIQPVDDERVVPYTIIEERYVQSPTYSDPESGELIQTSSRYVEILFEENNYDYLPTEGIAIGSLAFCLDAKGMLYFSSNGYWEIVGDNGGGGGGEDDYS